MAYEPEDDDDEWSPVDDDGVVYTGKEPRFLKIDFHEPHVLADMKVNDLVQAYVDLRNQLATDRKGWKARESQMKMQMQIISMSLREMGDKLGVDNFATAAGTAYRHTKETFRVADWEAVCKYVEQTNNFQILQKRVSPNAVKEIREADGELPPGIDPHVEVEFSVRSPTARKPK